MHHTVQRVIGVHSRQYSYRLLLCKEAHTYCNLTHSMRYYTCRNHPPANAVYILKRSRATQNFLYTLCSQVLQNSPHTWCSRSPG
jgi:hypothetical protein